MLRHPLTNKPSIALPLLFLTLLLSAFTLPTYTSAAADSAMQRSLDKFFSNGVALRGATAELIRVDAWPKAHGSLRWSLPNIKRGHPERLSLIAEQGKKRWYVPVRLHWWAQAVVVIKTVPARTLLLQDMMKRTRTDIAGHSGHWSDNTRDLIGMRLTRPLPKGEVILSSHIKRPPMIKRGDVVQIILDTGRIHVRSEGKAMRNASRGERILVKNLRSNEVIQAIAEKTGVVRISLGGNQG